MSEVQVSIDLVIRTACQVFNVPRDELVGQRRHAPLVRIRHLAMHSARKITGKPFTVIARYFGDRDHTTIIAAFHKIEDRVLDGDSKLAAEVARLSDALSQGG